MMCLTARICGIPTATLVDVVQEEDKRSWNSSCFSLSCFVNRQSCFVNKL